MPTDRKTPAIVRFGVFEVDLKAGELRKQGVKLKLQEQPFRVLTTLLEHPGEVVTREEMRAQIWADDTFVDFDNSLNTSVNKLREALGDSADSPRFIETVPRRGYRFIAPVSNRDLVSDSGTVRPHKSPYQTKIVAVVAVSAVAAIAGLFLWWRFAERLTAKDTIVLADFVNSTGDPIFDDTLKQGLRVQLEQSPFLNVLSDERVRDELGMMGRRKDERLTKELARDVCQRIGSKAILASSISKLGTRYVLGFNAVNCDTGDELGSEQIEADSKEHVLNALGRAATRLRKRLGESLASIQKFDVPIEQVTTSSLEALRAYSMGMRNKSANQEAQAIVSFSRAIELDPDFASAYARLSILYNNFWQVNLSRQSIERAYNLRDRVSERERLFFVAGYDWTVTGDLEKAVQTLELWAQSYPTDSLPHTTLTTYYMETGRWEKALVEAKKALSIDRGAGVNYLNLASVYLALGRFDTANDMVRQAISRGIDSSLMGIILYWTTFLTKQRTEMEMSSSGPNQEVDDLMSYIQSDTEAHRGSLETARVLSRRAINIALRDNRKESAAAWQMSSALRESEFGNLTQAQTEAIAAMKLAVNWKIQAAGALLFARTGDTTRAGQLVDELDSAFKTNTILQGYWLPTIRAAIELNRHNAIEAIELLQNAARMNWAFRARRNSA